MNCDSYKAKVELFLFHIYIFTIGTCLFWLPLDPPLLLVAKPASSQVLCNVNFRPLTLFISLEIYFLYSEWAQKKLSSRTNFASRLRADIILASETPNWKSSKWDRCNQCTKTSHIKSNPVKHKTVSWTLYLTHSRQLILYQLLTKDEVCCVFSILLSVFFRDKWLT